MSCIAGYVTNKKRGNKSKRNSKQIDKTYIKVYSKKFKQSLNIR
ncbi:hypothetical protein M141_1586 [Bacteroides fragilis str. S38L5]|nr:hypothetical protein M141_1586 [Bacteroides fragilis str. S38L5]EYB14945.1 hypothetical protein M140_1542 [Bacteroides fragilis str. S38L3]